MKTKVHSEKQNLNTFRAIYLGSYTYTQIREFFSSIYELNLVKILMNMKIFHLISMFLYVHL